MKTYFPQSRFLCAVVVLSSLASAVRLTAQTTYNWTGGAAGNWSATANWTPTAAPTTTDTANLNNAASANQTVTYDSGASGTLATLNITQTSAFTNQLSLAKSLTVTNDLTLAATGGGTSELYLSTAGLTLKMGSGSGNLTISSGGKLELATQASGNAGIINGNVNIAGGSLYVEQSTVSGSVINAIYGTLTISSGTLTLGGTTLQAGGTGVTTDNRFTVGGNFTATGGVITSESGSTLYLGGAINDLSGLTSFNTAVSLALNKGGSSPNQTLRLGATSVGNLLIRSQQNTGVTAISTVSATTGTIGSIGLMEQTANSSVELLLGSNLTTSGNAANSLSTNGTFGAARYSQATSGAGFIVDTGTTGNGSAGTGYMLDLTSISAANGGFSPNEAGTGNTTSANVPTTWTLQGSGTIKAQVINLSAPDTVNVSGNITLQAVGGTATANNLGGTGSIAATSTFLYSGAGTSASPATLTSNRAIGNLIVQSGALKIITTSLTVGAGAGVTVNSGALLDLSAQTISAPSFTLGISGAAFGQVKTAAGVYSYSPGLTFNIATAPVAGTTYDLFSGVTGSGASPTSVSISGLYIASLTSSSGIWTGAAGGYNFSFNEATGDLTVTASAIPEPATCAALAGFLVLGLAAWRRRIARG